MNRVKIRRKKKRRREGLFSSSEYTSFLSYRKTFKFDVWGYRKISVSKLTSIVLGKNCIFLLKLWLNIWIQREYNINMK